MFYGVAVDGDGGDGGHPLVVHLVDVLVDRLMMQQSEMHDMEKVDNSCW